MGDLHKNRAKLGEYCTAYLLVIASSKNCFLPSIFIQNVNKTGQNF